MSVDLDHPRSLGAIVEDTWRIYRDHLRLFLTIAVAVIVPVDLLVLGVGLGDLWHGPDHTDPNVRNGAEALLQFGLLTPLVTAGHIAAVTALGRGEAISPWRALEIGFERFAPVLAATLLSLVAIVLGTIACIVPGIFLGVALFFGPQAVVAEGRGPVDALRRSRELVRDQWWFALGVGLVFSVGLGIFGELIRLGTHAGAEAAGAEAIELTGTIAAHVIGIAFTALGGTLTYYTLRAQKEPTPPQGGFGGWLPPTAPDPAPGHTS